MKPDELLNVDRADKPVAIELPEGWRPGMAYYSVEEVNLQRDQYRWWSLLVTTDYDRALEHLRDRRRGSPDRRYRMIMSVELG